MEEESLIICLRIEYMQIAPAEKHKCSQCGAWVGITKASKEYFDKIQTKKKIYICQDCFLSIDLPKNTDFAGLSNGQIDELQKYNGDKNGKTQV